MSSWKSVVEKRTAVKGDVLVVGVDIGKRIHMAAGAFPDGGTIKKVRFSNDQRGFDLFLEKTEGWKRMAGCRSVIVGLESTGHYWENLAYWLDGHGVKLVQVNPHHVKKTKETLDNSPGKTDSKDAVLIADLVLQGKYLTLVLPRGVYAELRQLVGLRKRLVVDLSASRSLLHAAVDRVFPEFSTVFKDLAGKTARYILRHFPFPEEIVSMSFPELVTCLKRECYMGLREEKIRLLYEQAGRSVGVKEGLSGARMALHNALDKLEWQIEKLGELESRIKKLVAEVDEVRYMLSVHGIGLMTAATILSETCGMRSYNSAACVLKLAGLNLFEISSGQMQGACHISKRGRSHLRQALYFAALQQTMPGSALYSFYQRLVGRGVKKVKALIAVACKLVRLLFALVRDCRYYREQAPCRLAVACLA